MAKVTTPSIDNIVLKFEKRLPPPQPVGPFAAEVIVDEITEGLFGFQYHVATQDDAGLRRDVWVKIHFDDDGTPYLSGQHKEVHNALVATLGEDTLGQGLIVGRKAMFEYRPYFYSRAKGGKQERGNRDSLIALEALD